MGDTSKTGAPRAQETDHPPKEVGEYAQTCVQYVEKNIGVPLDFAVETLPILDHYLREARSADASRPEAGVLIATVAGCYLGEVLRCRHSLKWNIEASDPLRWSLSTHNGALIVFPIALARVAMDGPKVEPDYEVFAFDKNLRTALEKRLDDLPPVPEEEYVAPSTRVEVVDMAIDLLTGFAQHQHGCECEGCRSDRS